MSRVSSAFSQTTALLRENGPRKGSAAILARARAAVAVSGDVVWLVKDPVSPDATEFDHSPFELTEAVTADEHAALDQMRPLAPEIMALRLAVGGRRWALRERESGDLVYTAWTYTKELIISERPELRLPLPDGVWQLEDSYVPRAKRGARGAPAGVEMIGLARPGREGASISLVTKIDAENAVALHVADHSGWRRFATVHGRRVLGRPTRWRVSLDDERLLPVLRDLERR